jgi:hypothetical protein
MSGGGNSESTTILRELKIIVGISLCNKVQQAVISGLVLISIR